MSDRIAAQLSIAPDHPAFEGHFPGRPVVPAVVLLAEVLAAVEAATSRATPQWALASAKFLLPVMPGTALELTHGPASGGARRFEIRSAAGLVASGLLSPR